MGTVAIGTVIGIVPDGEVLAGWEIVATGDGGAITMKSGSCWGRYGDCKADAETCWDAVTARLWARLSDEEVAAKLSECRAEVLATKAGSARRAGAEAALRVTTAEAENRGVI